MDTSSNVLLSRPDGVWGRLKFRTTNFTTYTGPQSYDAAAHITRQSRHHRPPSLDLDFSNYWTFLYRSGTDDSQTLAAESPGNPLESSSKLSYNTAIEFQQHNVVGSERLFTDSHTLAAESPQTMDPKSQLSPNDSIVNSKEVKETCFFWYHGQCRRGQQQCRHEHEFRINWPINPPPGYVHWQPCNLPMCPFRKDLVECKEQIEREKAMPQVNRVMPSALDLAGSSKEHAIEIPSSSETEDSDSDTNSDSPNDSDDESDSSRGGGRASSPLTCSSPHNSDGDADDEPQTLSISHANTLPGNKRKAVNDQDCSSHNSKRPSLYSLKNASLTEPVYELPRGLSPSFRTSPSPRHPASPLESPLTPRSIDGVPLICFYWFHKGYCQPKRGRNGIPGRCSFLHTLKVKPQRVSLPPSVIDHNTDCPYALCPVRLEARGRIDPSLHVAGAGPNPEPESEMPRAPKMPAAMQAIHGRRNRRGKRGHDSKSRAHKYPQQMSTDERCKQFYDQQGKRALHRPGKKDEAHRSGAGQGSRTSRSGKGKQLMERKFVQETEDKVKQEQEEVEDGEEASWFLTGFPDFAPSPKIKKEVKEQGQQELGENVQQELDIQQEIQQEVQQEVEMENVPAKKFVPKPGVLVDYDLPEGENRAEWDTDFLRRAFGEIE